MAVQPEVTFLSYAREDSDFALRLARDLRSLGASVWVDQLDIPAGERWDRSVELALKRCPRLLVVLSPAAVDSHNVMDEVSFALEERKTLLPVLHRTCDIPFRLRRVQYIDFTNDYSAGLDRVLGTFGIQHAVHEPVQTVPEATQQPPHDPSQTMDADVSEAALLRFRALTKRCKGLGLVDDVIVDQLVSRGLKREKAVELVREKA